MKQRMVTRFYSVKVNAAGAASANPKNRIESGGSRDFTNHYLLFACVLVVHS
jgi:hypothetical protein